MACAVSPTESGEIISRFGIRPGIQTRIPRFHAGIDLKGRVGDPVYAAAEGIVDRIFLNVPVSPMRGYGNVIVVRHEGPIWTSYNHLDRVHVSTGDRVFKRDTIGAIGNTSNGKFPTLISHLHFEVRHAKPDGSIPFPGPYGRYNINPVLWLDANGLDPRTLRPTDEPCLSGARERLVSELRRRTRAVAGFGSVISWERVTEGQPAMDVEDYEPPAPERGILGPVFGVALIAAAAWVSQ